MVFVASASAALCLWGCTVGPNYKRPDPPAVPAWKDEAARGQLANQAKRSRSEVVAVIQRSGAHRLIEKGITGNLDVQQAVLRVLEARQGIIAARAAGLPTLSGNASYQREQLGAKGILESQGAYQDLNQLADRLKPYDATVPGLSQSIVNGGTQALNQLTTPREPLSVRARCLLGAGSLRSRAAFGRAGARAGRRRNPRRSTMRSSSWRARSFRATSSCAARRRSRRARRRTSGRPTKSGI